MLEGDGCYFLDGYLNTQYDRGKKPVKIKTAGSTGTAARKRHSTAVVDYQVLDHPRRLHTAESCRLCRQRLV
jgi:hypothetical protein